MRVPMAGPMAYQMGGPMGEPMPYQMGGPMGEPMGGPMGGPMGRQMGSPVGRQMGRQMGSPVGRRMPWNSSPDTDKKVKSNLLDLTGVPGILPLSPILARPTAPLETIVEPVIDTVASIVQPPVQALGNIVEEVTDPIIRPPTFFWPPRSPPSPQNDPEPVSRRRGLNMEQTAPLRIIPRPPNYPPPRNLRRF